MKILSIKGKNLASLEDEFHIDFAAEPLSSAGIFAITGSTGAGKSTILDALCLTLFDDTPRTSNASENIQISDVQDKTINQKDSRNILRRGAADGFAEVEFTSLSGDKYRSRWSVRRANNKPDGALQKTEIKLQNLTSLVEEQGTKKDLIEKIKELIGLSFDQFTRAVLLAQGDFATFLKSKEKEKAELLEKLTGTEIYSRISATIFRKTRDAEQDLLLMQQRIKDIRLLTDEELETLNQKKDAFNKELEPIRNMLQAIDKNILWLKQENQLKNDIALAENELKAAQKEIEEAKPRYEYMDMLDTSQEIRDVYLELANKLKQQSLFNDNLTSKEAELKSITLQLEAKEKDIFALKKELEETESKFTLLKPEIYKAKETDIKIQSAGEKVNEVKKEYAAQTELKEQVSLNIQNLEKQLQETQKASQALSIWFSDKEIYQDIIPRVDLIINLLNDAQNAKEQNTRVSKSLKANDEILATYKTKLELLEKDLEHLNNLLPVEVLNLREKLEDGKPCPVCGSIHHPLSNMVNENAELNEKELEQQRKIITEQISDIKTKIENTQKEITQQETLEKNYHSQYENAFLKAGDYLRNFPGWKERFETGLLQNRLSDFAKQWNKNKEDLDTSKQVKESLSIRLESEHKALNTVALEAKKREEALNSSMAIFNNLSAERKLLLDGKNAEDVEAFYSNNIQRSAKVYEDNRIIKDKLEAAKANIAGIISQIRKDIELDTEKIKDLQNSINSWLDRKNHQITSNMLVNLMNASREWILSEKEALTNLKNQILSLNATLKERTIRLERHNQSEDRPIINQDQDSLSQLLSETKTKEESIKQQLTEIEVQLATHKAGLEKVRGIEKELKEKADICENWRKLNVLLGSADGAKFKTIAQGYTLDILLGYANRHLEDLTKRYKLQRIPDTLALQVVDNDMLGEVRTVHLLSGGESFLISLALALGLSSLSSNRMKIESLFIDEGFGSLDIDTLSIAMDALENLQTQGRKIGVISHVEEMTERITAQIQVIKSANGRSNIRIVG